MLWSSHSTIASPFKWCLQSVEDAMEDCLCVLRECAQPRLSERSALYKLVLNCWSTALYIFTISAFLLLWEDSACGIILFFVCFSISLPKIYLCVGTNSNMKIWQVQFKCVMILLLIFFLFLHKDNIWINNVAAFITHLTSPVLTISLLNYSRCFFLFSNFFYTQCVIFSDSI